MKSIIVTIFLILPLSLCFVYASVYAFSQEAGTSYNIQGTTSVVIEPAQGGEAELITETGATASVFLPSEATTASAEVSVSSVNETDIASYAPIPSSLHAVSDLVYDFNAVSEGVTLTTFEQSITLTFSYTDTQVSGLDEDNIRVYYWDTAQQEWIICSDYRLDTSNNTIIINTNHFTLFAVMAPAPVCGDGAINSGEDCDGADLGGQTCIGLGYAGGALTCNSNCAFNTSNCVSGGGGGSSIQPAASVIFKGRAYPKSAVTLLKDAQIAATTVAGADAKFQIYLSGLSAGNYIFSFYSEDNKGRRSSLLTFPVSITRGATTSVSGIFIAPTIAVDKSEVKRGDNIAIFGQSTPVGEITILINSDEEFFAKITADEDGIYLYNFDTSPLEMAQHFTKSKTALNGEISSFSKTVSFLVGTKNIAKEKSEILKGNLNEDGRVNLVDFSIMAYWYKRPSPPTKIDLNNDNKVDLVDFSIMAYYWTG